MLEQPEKLLYAPPFSVNAADGGCTRLQVVGKNIYDISGLRIDGSDQSKIVGTLICFSPGKSDNLICQNMPVLRGYST